MLFPSAAPNLAIMLPHAHIQHELDMLACVLLQEECGGDTTRSDAATGVILQWV